MPDAPAIADPTRVGISKMQYLATVFGLAPDADPEAVAAKAIEHQTKMEEQILDLGKEFKAQADANKNVLGSLTVVDEIVSKLRPLVGLPDTAGTVETLTVVNRHLSAGGEASTALVGRLQVIQNKAQVTPGIAEAIHVLSDLRAQTEGKNAAKSTAAFSVLLSDPQNSKLPDVIMALRELEEVCVQTVIASADRK